MKFKCQIKSIILYLFYQYQWHGSPHLTIRETIEKQTIFWINLTELLEQSSKKRLI